MYTSALQNLGKCFLTPLPEILASEGGSGAPEICILVRTANSSDRDGPCRWHFQKVELESLGSNPSSAPFYLCGLGQGS